MLSRHRWAILSAVAAVGILVLTSTTSSVAQTASPTATVPATPSASPTPKFVENTPCPDVDCVLPSPTPNVLPATGGPSAGGTPAPYLFLAGVLWLAGAAAFALAGRRQPEHTRN